MDRQEAKVVLQAHRADDLDTSEPMFAEALALVERDAELRAWWEAQQAFDQRVASKLGEIEPPADLRSSILAGQKMKPPAPTPFLPFWLAVAACIAVMAAVGTSFHAARQQARYIPTHSFQETALAFLGNDAPPLGMTSADHDKIMAWLKDQKSPMGDLPTKLAATPSVGCQKLVMKGHSISLICFATADGKIVHLFMVHSKDLAEPFARSSPIFAQVNGWATASWADDQMSYMLATQAGEDELRQLL